MAGRMVPADLVRSEANHLTRRVKLVDRRLRFDAQPEHVAGLDGALIQEQVVFMEVDRNIERPLRRRDARDVVDVGVGQQTVPDGQPMTLGERQQRRDFITRIDQDRFARFFTGHDEAVLEKRSDGLRLDQHFCMIPAR